jgi:hypothetical protein
MVHELGIGFRRDAPLFLLPRLQFVSLQRLSNGLMGHTVNVLQRHHPMGQQAETPVPMSLRWLATRQGNQVRLLLSIQLVHVLTPGRTSILSSF